MPGYPVPVGRRRQTSNRGVRRPPVGLPATTGVLVSLLLVLIATLSTACGLSLGRATGDGDPAASVTASPAYLQGCAISGLDNTPGCEQVALDAIDRARAREGVRPMRLPAGFDSMPFDEQMLGVIDAERTDRRLPAVTGLTPSLDALAMRGAEVDDLPPAPDHDVTGWRSDAYSDFVNALDVDYNWMYDDGPDSGTPGCDHAGDTGCWLDRQVILADYPRSGTLVMGAADDPTGDTQSDDKGGPSMAMVVGSATVPVNDLTFTWAQLSAAVSAGTLRPLSAPPSGISATGIADPPHTLPPDPDYTDSCASSGTDSSAGCLAAILKAVDRARAMEGVKPMNLPADFPTLSIPVQLFVVVNLERVDRGLPPFVGLSAAMDTNAAKGAADANDPPDPSGVLGDDEEWSGGSVNGLDADYGWMYDDGRGSGNIDCPRTGGPGCWGHREGILDNFGTVGTMVMGAAFDPTGDDAASGWAGGTSMAVTMVATLHPPKSYLATWPEVLSAPPPPDA